MVSYGRKPGPKPKPVECGWCDGTGTIPVDPRDPRKGETTCHRCNGRGEL